jgi:hypothetical protein
MIEDLLDELSSIGWTVSWAFQFEAGHWRVSILKQIDERVYFSHCADAPTFAEALEDAMSKISDADYELTTSVTFTQNKSQPVNLLLALGLAKPVKILRRM